MDATDEALLRQYVGGSHPAFAELVRRHLNLVYSAARRQTSTPHLAEEVTQAVFISLSRSAAKLNPATPLSAWLHLATRHTAIDAARTEARRQAREQNAFELSAMNSTPSAWSHVEPLLDEAVAALPEADRSAILLRYFENKSLREVGAALGASEDAAQKRVTRAVEQMRSFFAQRGIALTAAGLATNLSAHAIETAPVALGATISAGAALSAGTGAAALETIKATAMTTLQKTTLATALLLFGGAGLYQARALNRQSGDLENHQQEVARLQQDSATLLHQRSDLARRVAAARDSARLAGTGEAAMSALNPATAEELKLWLARVDRLKDSFAADPEAWIPEMGLLSDSDWIKVAQQTTSTDPDNLRASRSAVRRAAMVAFSNAIRPALAAYLAAHGDALPPTVADLLPYFTQPVDPTALDRYEIISADQLRPAPNGRNSQLLIRERLPADIEFDALFTFGPMSASTSPAVGVFAAKAADAYAAAHGGQRPTTPEHLLPYLPQPVDPAKLKRYVK